jgi:hypothetical protein
LAPPVGGIGDSAETEACATAGAVSLGAGELIGRDDRWQPRPLATIAAPMIAAATSITIRKVPMEGVGMAVSPVVAGFLMRGKTGRHR